MLNGPKSKSTKKSQPEEHIDLAEYSDSSSNDESSGDEGEKERVDVKSLPRIAKDDATVARKLAAAKTQKKASVSYPKTLVVAQFT
jgi:hypothetical protein